MLPAERLFFRIKQHIDAIIAQDESGKEIWRLLLIQPPADIALLLSKLDNRRKARLFSYLPEKIASKVFSKMLPKDQMYLLSKINSETAAELLRHIPSDTLTDLFEHFSDKQLKFYLKLIKKKQRTVISSHLNFEPKSTGRIMNSEVMT